MKDASPIIDFITGRFPAGVTVTVAATSAGAIWIDVERRGKLLTIEWRPGLGFGLYHQQESGLGQGPDEVHREASIFFPRIEALISELGSKKWAPTLSWREVLGDEHYLLMLRDYEAIRARRKGFRGKPDEYDRAQIALDKEFEQFYKKFLD